MAKRIVLSKKRGFKRVPNKDFYKDGDSYHYFLYRNVLPISKFMYSAYKKNLSNVYIKIDLESLEIPESQINYLKINDFNGVPKESFNMENFIRALDEIIDSFGEHFLENLCSSHHMYDPPIYNNH